MEAAADLIVDSAPGHAVEGDDEHLPGFEVARQRAVQQERQVRRRGELRRGAEASPLGVEAAREGALGGGHHAHVGEDRGLLDGRQLIADRAGQHLGLLQHLAPTQRPRLAERGQDSREAGASHPVAGREVRPGEEGLEVVGQEDRVGPSARAGEELRRRHVDLVDVGALLPVELDRDEPVVHLPRDLGIGEALPLHDVAPVAGRIPHRQEDGLVLPSRLLEGLVPPRIPIDRVPGMEKEVRARFVCQAIPRRGHPRSLPCGAGGSTFERIG